jgi:small subunit ribosomal protein S5
MAVYNFKIFFMEKGKPRDKFKKKKEKPEFDQQIVDLARVTRVTKGGKQLSFRACVLIGDKNGRVGYGLDKGKDVQIAVEKAVNQAKKNLIFVPIVNETIPHRVEAKFKAGKVMIKPAPKGAGVIAGSSIRTVLEMAGVPNASSKMLGKTNNKISNLKAVFKALQSFKPSAVAKAREIGRKAAGKNVVEAAAEIKSEKSENSKS